MADRIRAGRFQAVAVFHAVVHHQEQGQQVLHGLELDVVVVGVGRFFPAGLKAVDYQQQAAVKFGKRLLPVFTVEGGIGQAGKVFPGGAALSVGHQGGENQAHAAGRAAHFHPCWDHRPFQILLAGDIGHPVKDVPHPAGKCFGLVGSLHRKGFQIAGIEGWVGGLQGI